MIKELFDLFRRESQLQQAFQRSYEMLDEDRHMFEAAINSLRSRDDARLDIDIYAKDQLINAYEREVRRKVFTHLVVSGDKDLNAALVLVSVVIDIERIGDFTKNIVELALHHPSRLFCGPFDDDVRRIETSVRTMFELLIDALPENDEGKAREVMSEHWWISRRADDIITQLIEKNDIITPSGDAVSCALYLRYLKRVSAHLMNIASSVVNPFDRIGFRGPNGAVEHG
jgi:phosphate uptake regulator